METTVIETTITLLASKVAKDTESTDALRFTQAALNLAHVLATLDNVERF